MKSSVQRTVRRKPGVRTAKQPDRFRLDGRTVVLTGAAGFLGSALVRGLLEAGARVMLVSRSADLPETARRHADAYGASRVLWRQVDFSDAAALARAAREIAREPVDVLINNAQDMSVASGFNAPAGRLERVGAAEWATAFHGVEWAALMTQAVGAGMKRRRRGSIINIASMYGIVSPHPALYEGTALLNPVTYGPAKAALIALTRYVAAFWGQDGVRCNAVAPGPFPRSGPTSPDPAVAEFLARVAARTLLGRVGLAEELVGPVLFLASDASSFVTGHTLVVDGGWTVT